MNKTFRILMSACGVLAVVGSVALGHNARTRVDMGRSVASDSLSRVISRPGLRASLTNQEPLTEGEYFYLVTDLLHREYVDPFDVDDKMAVGAVKGMVNSLLDPDSMFMTPAAYTQYHHVRQGEVEGVGIEIRYVFDQETIQKAQSGAKGYDTLLLLPKVMVAAVLPGGPAEAAGVKVGDEVRGVGDKFVVTAQDIKQIRETQKLVNEKKEKPEVLEAMRKVIEARIKANIPPVKVRDQLTLGDTGSVDLTLDRAGKEVKVKIDKKRYTIPAVEATPQGPTKLRFVEGAAQALAKLDWSRPVTLDLRQSTQGDFAVMQKCLDVLLPAQKVGVIATDDARTTDVVSRGPGIKAAHVELVVDSSTAGAAAVFAQSLAAAGYATLTGETYPDMEWIEEHALPGGSGYTLAVGKFRPFSKEVAK